MRTMTTAMTVKMMVIVIIITSIIFDYDFMSLFSVQLFCIHNNSSFNNKNINYYYNYYYLGNLLATNSYFDRLPYFQIKIKIRSKRYHHHHYHHHHHHRHNHHHHHPLTQLSCGGIYRLTGLALTNVIGSYDLELVMGVGLKGGHIGRGFISHSFSLVYAILVSRFVPDEVVIDRVHNVARQPGQACGRGSDILEDDIDWWTGDGCLGGNRMSLVVDFKLVLIILYL